MIPAEVPNWVVSLLLTGTLVIKFLWSGDLVATETALSEPWWRVFVRSGSFWLGVRFSTSALFIYGAIAYVLIADPTGTVPWWFAIGTALDFVATGLAFLFFTFTVAPAPDRDGGDDGS